MVTFAAWFIFAIGVAHIIYGLARFRSSFSDAVSAGFFDQFWKPELRRTAFWFTIFGLPLMCIGQIAIRAVAGGDLTLLKIIGFYMLITSVIGITAFPKSPFWAPLVASLLAIAASYGLFA